MFGRTVTVDCDALCNEKHDLDAEYRATLNYVNHDKTKENEVFFYRPLEEIYQEQFGQAIEDYNARQDHKNRKKTVKGYMEELEENVKAYMAMSPKERKNDNHVKSRYELVLYVGDMVDTGYDADPASAKIAEEVLTEYIKGFPARNPCLIPQYGYLHKDEVTPHGGLTFVAVADGYNRGLSRQVSLSRALSQQGFPDKKGVRGYDAWIKSERAELRRLAEERGFTIIEKNDPKRDKQTRAEYISFKKAMDSATDEQVKSELDKLLEKPLKSIKKAEKGLFGYSNDDYERLFKAYINLGRRCLAAENLNARTGVNDAYLQQEQIEDLKKRLDKALAQADGFRDIIKSLRKDVNTLVEGLSARGVREVSNQLQNDGYGAKLAQKRVSQLDKLALRKATLKTKGIDENTKNFSRTK